MGEAVASRRLNSISVMQLQLALRDAMFRPF